MQLTTIPLMKRIQGREIGLLYSSHVRSVQKLPSTTDLHLRKHYHCISLKGLDSPLPRACLALVFTAECRSSEEPSETRHARDFTWSQWPVPGLRLSTKSRNQSTPARNGGYFDGTSSSILKGRTQKGCSEGSPANSNKRLLSRRQWLGSSLQA